MNGLTAGSFTRRGLATFTIATACCCCRLCSHPLGRSQGGAHAGAWLSAVPSEPALTLAPQAMQLALRRRLRLPLPLSPNRCGPSPGCGQQVDEYGDHALACPRTELLARRAKASPAPVPTLGGDAACSCRTRPQGHGRLSRWAKCLRHHQPRNYTCQATRYRPVAPALHPRHVCAHLRLLVVGRRGTSARYRAG